MGLPVNALRTETECALLNDPLPGASRHQQDPDGQIQQLLAEVEIRSKTISTLESEKNALLASMQQLESSTYRSSHMNGAISFCSTFFQEMDALLQQERFKTQELESRVRDLDANLQSQQQTISLLVSEKASLATSLEQLESVEASASRCDLLVPSALTTLGHRQPRKGYAVAGTDL